MATVTNPWGAVRDAIEEAAQDETLSPDARISKLKLYADDLNDLLGRTSTYIGGLELVREGRPAAYADQVVEARADADLREVLLERGLADAEELDVLGYLSHADLDALSEEALLDEWLDRRAEIRAADLREASVGEVLQQIWDQARHPRGSHGRFRDVLGRNIQPKGRHGRAVPSAPQAPGGERPRGFQVHDDVKHDAFVGKSSELGKFKEVRPTPDMGSEVVLGGARDTQEMYSWLDQAEATGVPMMPGGERMPTAPEDIQRAYEAPPGQRRLYSDERAALHDKIVDLYFRQRKQVVDANGTVSWQLDPQGAPVPVPDATDRTMVFLAGGTASGKSVSSRDPRIANAIPHPQETVHIDPDEIKGLLPEYKAILGLGDESSAGAVHEESSDLSKRILKEALARGSHIVMDGTGDSKPGNFPRKIQNAVDLGKQAGHDYRTKVLYFDAPVDIALQRESKRAEETGRKVHEHTVRAIHAGVAANFGAVQGLHDQGVIQDLAVHDTSNGPHLISGDVGPEVPRIGSELSRAGSEEQPVNVGGNVALAAALLSQGRRVELNQPREVSTLLDRMSKMVKEAEKKGKDAPTFDLCKVSVKGTNLFCAQSKGIPRVQMPQLKGTPQPGSRADRELPRDAKGRVSLDDAWREHLRNLGVRTEVTTEKASHLRASQNELNGANVARIMGEMEGGRETLPIFVSRDNYVLDGHHQWAGRVGRDSRDGKLDLDMPVERIDMPIMRLLEEANRFTKAWGMPQRKLKD